MPDQPEAPAEADVETTTPEADANESPEQQTPKPTETVEYWKSKSRDNEKRAKENAAAAVELAALKDKDKSELQLEREARQAAERERDEERAQRQIGDWKAQVAKNPKYAGVTADVLRGSTLEEIEDHAASLKALLPEPRPGHVPTEGRTVTPGSGDPAQQFASLITNQLRNS